METAGTLKTSRSRTIRVAGRITAWFRSMEDNLKYVTALAALLAICSPVLARNNYSSHPGAAASVLDKEPDRLGYGDTVLVNDGSCPAGQVKQVTGGNKNKGVPRSHQCVAR